jgi:hypothetical protein
MHVGSALKSWARWTRSPLALVALAATSQLAAAQSYYRDAFHDIRFLGRGNTGVADVDDASSVFYNPAGIAANKAFGFTILNPFGAANQNFYSSSQQILTLTSGSESLSERFSPLLGKPLAIQGGVMPSFAMPRLMVGVFDYADASLEYRDPVYPRLSMDVRNDYGVVIGSGYSFMDMFFVGASLRYTKRRQYFDNFTAETLISGATSSALRNIQRMGEGFGINLGAQFRYKVTGRQWFALGSTIEDLGFTRFKNADRNVATPLQQAQMINFGTAYGYGSGLVDMKFLADIRQFTNWDISFTKKIFLGVEASLLKTDFRVGLFQGYWTAGMSVRILPFMALDVATYAEELDAIAGQRSNRFYMIGFRTGLSLKKSASSAKRRKTIDNL